MLSVIFASSRVSLNAIRSMNLLVIEKLISSIFFGRLTIFRNMRGNSGIFKDEAKQKQETKIFKGQSKSTIC
jgi:hypothetical protein